MLALHVGLAKNQQFLNPTTPNQICILSKMSLTPFASYNNNICVKKTSTTLDSCLVLRLRVMPAFLSGTSSWLDFFENVDFEPSNVGMLLAGAAGDVSLCSYGLELEIKTKETYVKLNVEPEFLIKGVYAKLSLRFHY